MGAFMTRTKNTAATSRRAAAPKPLQPQLATSSAPAESAKAAEPGSNLTDFQQLVCNLAADLILNGGHKADVKKLIAATMGHSFRVRLP
jgi:hypothetical protein